MLFSWYLRDWLMCPMCHAFHFPSTFPQLPSIHPLFSASGFHYLPHSLHFYACTFLLPHFHPPRLLSHLYSQQTLFSSCLSLWLAEILSAPSSTLPLTSCSYFLCLLCLSHTPPQLFPQKRVSAFPSFEALSRLFQ